MVKNSIGNGEAKELIYTTHGLELRGGECFWGCGAGQRGIKGRKKMGHIYNSIINKYIKKKAIINVNTLMSK